MPEEIKKENHGQTLMSWEFPEFIKYKRSSGWYVITFIIIAGLLAFAIYSKSYLFILIIVLVVIIYIINARREPAKLKINVTEDGIEISEKFYPYKDIRSFWIIYEPPEVKKLYFDFKSGIRPSFSISLENQNPLKVRKILLDYLVEDKTKENESLSDGLSRILKL